MRLVTALLILLAACGHTLPPWNYPDEPDPRGKEVVLGVGDGLSIIVWGQENKDFNTEATVRGDGNITMPLIGDIKAAGQTPTTLKKEIATKLATYVKPVQGTELVTVILKAWRSYRFTITGEVVRQGVFNADHFVTVADAIALAGGPSRFAKRSELVLFRLDPETGNTKKIPLDYDLLTSGKRLDMNIYVLAGDVIYVP